MISPAGRYSTLAKTMIMETIAPFLIRFGILCVRILEINHCTVTEYVTEKRLSQAESLLSSTSLTIEQIATAVGYSNPSRFAALFKKNTGIFPSDYRRMSK